VPNNLAEAEEDGRRKSKCHAREAEKNRGKWMRAVSGEDHMFGLQHLGLNCAPQKRNTAALTSSASKYNLTWKQGHRR
jgi:hypothetical protein